MYAVFQGTHTCVLTVCAYRVSQETQHEKSSSEGTTRRVVHQLFVTICPPWVGIVKPEQGLFHVAFFVTRRGLWTWMYCTHGRLCLT